MTTGRFNIKPTNVQKLLFLKNNLRMLNYDIWGLLLYRVLILKSVSNLLYWSWFYYRLYWDYISVSLMVQPFFFTSMRSQVCMFKIWDIEYIIGIDNVIIYCYYLLYSTTLTQSMIIWWRFLCQAKSKSVQIKIPHRIGSQL